MAHIETWYRCPACSQSYGSQREATNCRNAHPIISERWAGGKGGKAVRISENCSIDGYGGLKWALKEADLSDLVEVRKQQLRDKCDK
jgi:hypothetical protein